MILMCFFDSNAIVIMIEIFNTTGDGGVDQERRGRDKWCCRCLVSAVRLYPSRW